MELFKNLNYGRQNGIIGMIAGILFLGINYLSLRYSDYYYPSILYVGWMIIFLGVALLIVPGPDIQKGEIHADARELKYFLSISPTYAKAIWIIAMLGGLLFAFFQERIINNPLLEIYG